jgi:hypothetical protein
MVFSQSQRRALKNEKEIVKGGVTLMGKDYNIEKQQFLEKPEN